MLRARRFALTDIILDALIDTFKLIPFLFIAYLAIEIIEDRAEEKTIELVNRAGRLGPVIGGALGVIPQCGFSAATSNLYAGGIISRGTLLAVFLSTSDEMLPILLSHSVPGSFIIKVLLYKVTAGIIAGLIIDTVEKKIGGVNDRHIHDMCEREGCKCEDGVFKSAVIHTAKIALFLLVMNFIIGLVIEYVGSDTLSGLILNKPVAGELISGLIGLIPNCAASVVITELYLEGGMSLGAMLSGLLAGSGVGLMVLFRMDGNRRDCLINLGVLYVSGVVFGLIANLLPIA